MGKKGVITDSGIIFVDYTPEEEAQQNIDRQETVAKEQTIAEENTRLDTFKQVADRETFVEQLKTRTANEVESFVRSRVDADSVTDQASAKDCLKRIETGMVRLLQLVAFVIKE